MSEMNPRRMRAGDADRDAALEIIQQAFSNGRLTPEEVTARQDEALAARFTDELYPLVSDLPEAARLAERLQGGAVVSPQGGAQPPAPFGAAHLPATTPGEWRFAIMSGRTEELAPGQIEVRTMACMGGDTIYTRDAFGPGVTITMELHTCMGGNTIYVPEGVRVVDASTGFMGGNDVKKGANGDGSNGTLILRGIQMMGGSTVKLDKRQR